ncbi:MAG TPA: hypothetical protein VFZ31_11010 [Vicinamibacterales bacterium]
MERQRPTEYLVLRQTIAQRGTLRPILVLTGLALWAVTLIAVLALLPYPVAAAIPLLVLVTTFEVIRPLHFGAERIGRYLQVFYEEDGDPSRPMQDTPSWERVAMSFGVVPGVGGHALFVPLFLIATALNYLAVLLPRPVTIELSAMAIPHLAFIAWMVAVDRAMRTQRAVELARLRELRQGKNP